MARRRPDFSAIAIVGVCLTLAAYFCFAAVQSDYGVLERAKLSAEAADLQSRLDDLETQIAQMENRTRRLSDGSLDLDLLDQQARDVLGLIRPDEIILQ